jgi:hypothetical protein
MPLQILLSLVKHAIKSLGSDKAKKKGLAAGSHQALSDLQELKLWNWEEHAAEDQPREQ